ncbi:DnaJ domain-containing protein [Magnetospirillum sp. UT-4]|uniref:DnaJ domain-containing protein n=1 Tax=Magnetospirillum sp. UT-4 TaxID=2681467 RepID=UPI001381B882|nr:DnaJ domain-containing protein [Magnetospirillum sp. UT-4]CAA7611717.1 DnaJ-class molecular chaperone with C-terminal Zn finger domain [Magnetospirillum sp. UT-4]
MTTAAQDPKGYYATLGIAPGAGLDAIRAAYRSRVKLVHPDRDPSAAAREEFQELVEAYRVLKDGVYRAEYDSTGVPPLIDDGDDWPAHPYACSTCGKVTAQPRYVIFHWVKSYLVWVRRGRTEGIFCRDCADLAAVRASTASWAWGWWSPPGLVLTPLALVLNMLGGVKPRHVNARLLIRQARAFLALDEYELARGLARQAEAFAHRSVHQRQVEELQRITGIDGRRLRDRWAFWAGGAFAAQALPLAALAAVLVLAGLIATKPWDQPVATAPAGIVVEAAGIGDIRHVAVDDLKLRQAPLEGAPVLTLLDRFTTVQVIGLQGDPEWAEVRSPAGVVGWVQRRALYAGPGSLHKHEWCAANLGSPPQGGEALVRRATGEHRLLIHNDNRRDAVVKLKTVAGVTVASFYVPATHHIGVGGIPDGTFRIEFSTGTKYSRACGVFTGEAAAGLMPFTLSYKQVTAYRPRTIPEISLLAAPTDPRRPQPLDLDRFAEDD